MISARTFLFTPATRPDRFPKAAASGADAIILDLEDAVPAGEKAAARGNLDADFTELPVILRLNAIDTPWFAEDAAAAKGHGFAAVMLPKTENPEAIRQIVDIFPEIPVIPLIETARGLAHLREIAASPGVFCLAFGSVDFCTDLQCAHRQDVLLPVRHELVLASRLADIVAPIDGITVEIEDPEIARRDAEYAKTMGMSGKLCIHPRQIAGVRTAFLPSESEIIWAHRVLEAPDGAVMVDGEMVDKPVRSRAQAIISRSA